MSSRRKASTPCMIRPEKTPLEPEDDEEESRKMEVTENHVQEAVLNMELSADSGVSDKDSDTRTGPDKPQKEPPDPHRPQRRQQGGYECKYCTFSTQNLNTFKDHVDSNHPNVILNPLYLCAVCNFTTKKFDTLTEHNERCHPGESNFKFKRVKVNKQTILEQSIEGSSSNAVIYNTARTAKAKTQCTDAKRTESLVGKPLTQLAKKPITALNVNGTVIIPESSLLKADSLSHIMPSLQQPVNYTQVPKIAVPLNTTKYNPTLDDNLTLMSSFNKFPYPTQAELSWLTAASKHPEEQIKVWFTTQRLKQGISWSPEEVEEARKKMFNGTISSAPQTLTVVASQLSSPSNQAANAKPFPSAASILQSLPCQILGQTSLVLTPVANGSSITCAPLALTLANQVTQSLKRPLATPAVARESKRPSIIQTTSSPKAPSFTADPNKTAEQLSVLRSSYTQSPFPEEDEIYRLIETTGLSREEIKKWFSEQRLLNLRSVASPPVLVKAEAAATVPDVPVRKAVPTQFPLLERVKGKSSEQLNALEESFQRSSSPTEKELDQLAQDIRLSKTEVDCWFSERRALRDNMEKVRFTMASKSTEERLERAGVALLNGGSHREQDGGAPSSSSSSSSSSPPVLAASSPQAPPNSSSRSPPILNSSSPHPPVLLASSSLSLITSGTLVLLREMFCRTQWPSPEEYSQLELQTRLGRTDIVRWFKDHRSALKNGQALDWMLPSQKQNQHQNGQICESDQSVSLEVKVKVAESGRNLEAAENSRRPSQDKRATQDENDVDQKSDGAPNKGRWVTASVAAGEETGFTEVTERQRPVTDTGVVTKEQPGRVTG